MPSRRQLLAMIAAGAAGTWVAGPGTRPVGAQPARRRVTIGGRPVRLIDGHAHCVIPVTDIVQGTPLAKMGGGGGGAFSDPFGCR
jgi:hypothetical protein